MSDRMSTRDFLKGLDYRGLVDVRRIADALIRDKEDSDKVLLWRVCDDDLIYGYFTEDRYVEAAELLLKTARDQVADEQVPLRLESELFVSDEAERLLKEIGSG